MPLVKSGKSSSRISSNTGESPISKGKGKAVEGSSSKRPPSQLKQGWALVPLVLKGSDNNDTHSKRARSPTKRQSLDNTDSTSAGQNSRKKGKTASAKIPLSLSSPKRSSAIEILSDSDDDIKEVSVTTVLAKTSVVQCSHAVKVSAVSCQTVEKARNAIQTPPVASTSKLPKLELPVETFDLNDDEGDFDEDLENIGTTWHAPETFADENEVLEEADDWGDGEKQAWHRSRSGSLNAGEYAEEEDFRDEFEDSAGLERSGESDEDILELMNQETEPQRRLVDQDVKGKEKMGDSPSKGLLKPLSSLQRGVSPSGASPAMYTSESRPNAFTALMQGNNLDKQWADAAENEAQPWRKGYVRPAPFYKILDGMTIAVDAFKYGKIPGVEAYFLSHAHSDHYTNLSSSWCNGPIYCSVGTANLIRYKLGVKDEWLHPLDFDKVYDIAGTKVTLLDANHCPGSSIFVFEGPHTSPNSPFHKSPKKHFRYLHCGDFRASPAHLLHPALKNKKVDICYLDTTYLNPRYCFPAQEQVVAACAELIRARVGGDREALMRGSGGGAQLVRQGEMMKGWLSKAKKEEEEEEGIEGDMDVKDMIKAAVAAADAKPVKPAERLLVMVGTYSIGKERIVKGIARAINGKVYCDQRKKEIFACQDDPELMSMVTDNPLEAQIHVTWLGQIKVDLLSDYLDKFKPHFSSIVGLRPTGWTFKPEGTMALTLKNPSVIQMLGRELQRSYNPSWMTPTKDSTRTVEAYGVPYSEHSSFAELTCFAVSLDCVKFIPTVNVGSKKSRSAMAVWFDKWAMERKRRKAAGEPLMVPHRTMQYW